MVKLLCLEWSRMDEGGLHNTCYKDSANGTFRMPWDIRQDEGWTGNGSHRSNGMELTLLLVQPKLHRELEKNASAHYSLSHLRSTSLPWASGDFLRLTSCARVSGKNPWLNNLNECLAREWNARQGGYMIICSLKYKWQKETQGAPIKDWQSTNKRLIASWKLSGSRWMVRARTHVGLLNFRLSFKSGGPMGRSCFLAE